ncbi:oxidoreductase [candidate division BRC1 bacterium HGW-BRC1-1]|jgi:3-hydroxyisobutyrate dehydrogenase|nr:MAG: oxidoreductase [candidate division BRC1 bacterium HGW-BRC1-1]
MTLSSQRIAWIGTGIMGSSMCAHLLKAGYPVTVHTRTRSRAAGLEKAGAAWADTPADAVKDAEFVFSIVGYPDDVREVYFGEKGIFAGQPKTNAVLIDMTTTEPTLAVEIEARASELGLRALDAPVSGGDTGARAATLSIMVGGDSGAFEAALPLLELLGKNISHQGTAGTGQHAKMCNQIVIAGTMIGVCESLLYAQAAGLNSEAMLKAISGGAASCWTLNNLAPRALQGDFAPGFLIDHFIKDMGIALKESRRMKIALPGLALVEQIYRVAANLGHGRDGTHALLLALEEINGQHRA